MIVTCVVPSVQATSDGGDVSSPAAVTNKDTSITHALVAQVVNEAVEVGGAAGEARHVAGRGLVEDRVQWHRQGPAGVPETQVQQGLDGLHRPAAAVAVALSLLQVRVPTATVAAATAALVCPPG